MPKQFTVCSYWTQRQGDPALLSRLLVGEGTVQKIEQNLPPNWQEQRRALERRAEKALGGFISEQEETGR